MNSYFPTRDARHEEYDENNTNCITTHQARSYEYELEKHEINGIQFKTTFFDTDYIIDGYEFPNNNEKVVVYHGFNSKDTTIYISNWKDFHKNNYFYGNYINCMIFNENTDNKDIINISQKFILNQNNYK